MSIFDVEVSAFERITFTTDPKPVKLGSWLLSAKYRHLVERIRQAKARGISKAEYQAMKKELLPVATISGTFSQRNDDSLITHSGFVCIDIDGKDNQHIGNFDELKDELKKLPYSAYIGRSVGGDGYYMLFRIKHPEQHLQHYNAILHGLKRAGIKCDPTSDLSRCRYYSYDPDAYFNEQAKVFPFTMESPEPTTAEAPQKKQSRRTIPTGDTYRALIDAIIDSRTDITAGAYGKQGWHVWRNIALAIASHEGETGRTDFHTISQYYKGYDSNEANTVYTKALRDCTNPRFNRDIGYLFKVAQSYGISYKSAEQPRANPNQPEYGYPASWDDIPPPDASSPEYIEMIKAEIKDSGRPRPDLVAELDKIASQVITRFDAILHT